MSGAAPNANLAFTGALFAELARSGVAHVCVAPGSRSAPLTVAAVREPAIECSSHIDERVAGFFALGLAKASGAPVAIVCTSGTAAVNLHPAVVEAHHAGVPLLLLTADRPPELRDWGAGQTIDQHALYGTSVRWFAEAPLPEAGEASLRTARALACRAAAVACGPRPGPVHLNLPFREPLAPDPVPGTPPASGVALTGRDAGAPFTSVVSATRTPDADAVRALAADLAGVERGVVVCGPLDAPADTASAIAQLAERLGWPLFAEATSPLRRGAAADAPTLVAHFDALLRCEAFADAAAPDAVLRFGATPTSKSFRLWLERTRPARVIHVDPTGAWHDASHLASDVVRAAPAALCEALLPALEPRPPGAWLDSLRAAERRARELTAEALAAEPDLHGPAVVQALGSVLPEDAWLYVANSLAVRDLDAYLPPGPRLRVLCNRGANGIDGTVASALGAAAAAPGRPGVLLTGDVAFLHDASALLSAQRNDVSTTCIVLDDDGGAIFSLPIAAHADSVGYDRHFRTRHGADVVAIAAAYGARAVTIESREHLRTELKQALAEPGVDVLRVPIDPDAAQRFRKAHQASVREAVAPTPAAT